MAISQRFETARDTRKPDLAAEARVMHDALAAIHVVGGAVAAETSGARLIRAPGMCLSIASRLPRSAIVLNHGFTEPTAEAIGAAASIYRRAGVERFFLSTDKAPASGALGAAGLRPTRNWRKFRRTAADPIPPITARYPIQRVGSEQRHDIARIVADAFDLGEVARPWLATLPEAPGWQVFVAVMDGEVAATGALYVADGYAWTDFGATRSESRGRGAQKALLAHRIRVARSLGCHTVVTCTGEAVPGEAQISYRNILAQGFEEAELMLNFEPSDPEEG